MKKNYILLGASLIALSVILHGVHYAVFHDMHHLMIFLVADIAFIPLEVFFVSLVLEQIIKKQEEEKIIKKMNMLVGLFYQQFGNKLLALFVEADKECSNTDKGLLMNFSWDSARYKELKKIISAHGHRVDLNKIDLSDLYKVLKENQPTIINLISNPTLLEKDDFSEVLMSTFHLLDELESRDLENLSKEDFEHLEVDCMRVYENLSIEWVYYMEHLQESYPYLFYTAVTNNPYDQRRSQVIETELMETLATESAY